MESNAKKYQVLGMEINSINATWDYKIGNSYINKARKEKEFGVTIQDVMPPESKTVVAVLKTMINMKVAFSHINRHAEGIYSHYDKQNLKHAPAFWSPYLNNGHKLQKIL